MLLMKYPIQELESSITHENDARYHKDHLGLFKVIRDKPSKFLTSQKDLGLEMAKFGLYLLDLLE